MKRLMTEWFLFLAAVFGVLGFPLAVFQTTGSTMLAALVFAATAAALLIAFLAPAMRLLHNLRSGYPIHSTPSFVALRKVRIKIDEGFEARIERWRDFVFMEEPKGEELVDMLDTLPGHVFSPADYHSSTSTISGITQVKPHIMAVQWSPKKPILPMIPYRHHTVNRSPSLYGPDYLYYSTYFDRATGRLDVKVDTPQAIEEALAFVMPRFRRNVSEWVLVNKGLRAKRRKCSQPALSADKKGITWNLYQPKVGRIYVLLAIYEGERERLLERARSQSWSAMIGRAWTDIFAPTPCR